MAAYIYYCFVRYSIICVKIPQSEANKIRESLGYFTRQRWSRTTFSLYLALLVCGSNTFHPTRLRCLFLLFTILSFFPTLYHKVETYIPRNEIVRPRSQLLHSWIWEKFTYSHDRSSLEYLFSCIDWKNSQLYRRSREKGRELPPSSNWQLFPALSSTCAAELAVHINDQHTNFNLENFES